MRRLKKSNQNINQKLLVFKSTTLMKTEIKLKTIKESRRSHHYLIMRNHILNRRRSHHYHIMKNHILNVLIKLAFLIIINEDIS